MGSRSVSNAAHVGTDRHPEPGSHQSRTVADLAALVAAALLVLFGSFANFLAYHSYPWLRPEVALVALGLAALAVIIGVAHHFSPRVGKAIIDGLLWALLIDLNADQPLLAALAALVAVVARITRNISLLTPLAIISAVILVSAATGLSERRPGIATATAPTPAALAKPAILHLILDEHGGVDAIEDAQFRQLLSDFYTDRGFRLFSRAYARHFHTVNAIPDALNFGQPGASRTRAGKLDIGRTAYFSRLEQAGYRINVTQSDFADYCQYARVARCTTYWSPSLALIAPLPLTAPDKARLIGYKFVALSDLVGRLAGLYDRARGGDPLRGLGLPAIALRQHSLSSSIGGFAGLDRMISDMPSARPGNVYFGHLLAPHYPYARSSDCKVLPPGQWGHRRSSRPIAERQAAYQGQVTCLLERLDKLIAAFDQATGKDGVIVIHGDHGSRITRLEPLERNAARLAKRDLMAGYSTLFAVRARGLAGGVDRVPYAVPHLLERVSSNRFASLAGLRRGTGQVFLERHGWAAGKPFSIADAWPSPD